MFTKKVAVCGVDCHPGTPRCNGYCNGSSNEPPEISAAQQTTLARDKAIEALDRAQKAWHEYAAMCDVGPERIRAFEVFDNIRLARRVG